VNEVASNAKKKPCSVKIDSEIEAVEEVRFQHGKHIQLGHEGPHIVKRACNIMRIA
jgi:hypothetical protein